MKVSKILGILIVIVIFLFIHLLEGSSYLVLTIILFSYLFTIIYGLYVIGFILLIVGLFRNKFKKKFSYGLITCAFILFAFNYYRIYKHEHEFTNYFKEKARNLTFEIYIPKKIPGDVVILGLYNTKETNNPYISLEFKKGLFGSSNRLYEFDKTKTQLPSDNCGPDNPEYLTILDPPICNFYATVQLGDIYKDHAGSAYLTINNTRIAIVTRALSKEEVIGIFSSLEKTSSEKVNFINKVALP